MYNLFEMNYRFGSLVFGGGDVLIPMMYEQYVTRPQSPHILKTKREVVQLSKEDFIKQLMSRKKSLHLILFFI